MHNNFGASSFRPNRIIKLAFGKKSKLTSKKRGLKNHKTEYRIWVWEETLKGFLRYDKTPACEMSKIGPHLTSSQCFYEYCQLNLYTDHNSK